MNDFTFENVEHGDEYQQFARVFPALQAPLSSGYVAKYMLRGNQVIGMFAYSTVETKGVKMAHCHCHVLRKHRSYNDIKGVVYLLGTVFVNQAREEGYTGLTADCPEEEKAVAHLFRAVGMATKKVTIGQILL